MVEADMIDDLWLTAFTKIGQYHKHGKFTLNIKWQYQEIPKTRETWVLQWGLPSIDHIA
jgi:hypothetical protein